ncbi:LysR family transcriptional regulator [Pseudoalteromonas sp. Of7M-16]|uniref:LysR family transcriptional regulator n=1 Tax=Pseudoalteromonas sp. Of7M-16 TaxID=2917756 RepID=UPI001EF49070|nr:LysR family transcriptional regulator [Pseudoalteromonas sp. Of7M-16]MCG7546555.1 LysR family transcriptional regulator [Pseudoalteromonas sp. Of7M-16]
MNKLRHMSLFAHIVESGSITAAASDLGLSKSVLSQHLKVLEQELGVALLKRTTRKQSLTAAGESFYGQCKLINQTAQIAWLEAAQFNQEVKGKLKITAPNVLMTTLVAPALAQICVHYPQLQLELLADDQQLDLQAQNIDLAIRVGRSQNSDAKQRKIGEFRDVLCGAPQLLASHPPQQLRYIANVWQGADIEHVFISSEGNEKRFSATPSCVANSFDTCMTLICQGAGIGLIPEFKLSQYAAHLAEVFPHYKLPLNPVFALHTFDKQVPLSIKVCLEAIENQLAHGMGK